MMQNPVNEKTIVAVPTKPVKKSHPWLENRASIELKERFTPTKI